MRWGKPDISPATVPLSIADREVLLIVRKAAGPDRSYEVATYLAGELTSRQTVPDYQLMDNIMQLVARQFGDDRTQAA